MNTMKKDNDLKRNASGYYDEPCYKAVTAPPKVGEIWTHKQSGAYMLVMASVGGVCSTLRLTDANREGSIKVMCKTPMYVTLITLGYCFENMLSQFVKSVKGDEFTAVKTAVAQVLGIPMTIFNHDQIIKLEDKLKALTDENDGLKKSYQDVFKENERLHYDLKAMSIAEGERDEMFRKMDDDLTKANVYKDMYMELLDKLISAKAGAGND